MSYKKRLMLEHTDLSIKIEKLREFIVSNDFEKIPDVERSDLKEQHVHMENYYEVLCRRVSRICGNA